MIQLNLKDVVANGLKALDEGRLQFQQENPGDFCVYASPCIIGASLPGDVAKSWDEEICGIGEIIEMGKAESDDQGALEALQAVHDDLVEGRSYEPISIEEANKIMREKLQFYQGGSS